MGETDAASSMPRDLATVVDILHWSF